MRRRQQIALQPQFKPLTLRERLFEASREDKECVICGREINLGLIKHFDSCWNRINKHLRTT